MNNSEIINVFNEQKSYLISEGIKYSNRQLLSFIDVEDIIDEILLKTIASNTKFNNELHLKKYLYVALKSNLRKEMKIKYISLIPELTNKERLKNYELARDIINNARNIKQGLFVCV